MEIKWFLTSSAVRFFIVFEVLTLMMFIMFTKNISYAPGEKKTMLSKNIFENFFVFYFSFQNQSQLWVK